MNYIQINTSQNVNLKFQVASIGKRMLAFILDWVFKGAYIIILAYIAFEIFNIDAFLAQVDSFSAIAIVTIALSPIVFYTLVSESLMEGQTPGKKIIGIKVIKIDGYQAKFSDYLIRWFFAIIDIYFSTALVGITSFILSKNTQRLGGIASGTAVIDLKNNININHTILQEVSVDYKPQFQQVLLLSDNDMQIIKTHFQDGLKRKDYKIIKKLALKIKEITQINNTNLNDKDFIERIIKDYNYLTAKEN
ncbi:RDD family protein [Weeksellaceae bacterium TAE3-ERU29]|nr:RDD family protein [Weeksellaceae bacterium TAE3-ERU29]